MRSSLFDQDSREITRILLKLVSNLLMNPGIEKYRVVKPANKTISKLLTMYEKALDYLFLLGFVSVFENNEKRVVLRVDQEEPKQIETGMKVLKDFAKVLGVETKHIPNVSKYISYDFKQAAKELKNPTTKTAWANEFDHYQASTVSTNYFPQKGVGNMLMTERVEKLRLERLNIMSSAGIPERELKVYTSLKNFNVREFQKQVKQKSTRDDPAMEGGMNETSMISAANQALKAKNENRKIMKTRAMKEFEKLQNEKVYTKVLLRVHLPNRWTIEANFSPLETITDVFELITKEVFDPVEFKGLSEEIYFYSTPPKTIFMRTEWAKTLSDFKLAPASMIYMNWGKVDQRGRVVKSPTSSAFKVDYEKLINTQYVVNDVSSTKKAVIPKSQHLVKSKKTTKKAGTQPASKKKKLSKKPKWLDI